MPVITVSEGALGSSLIINGSVTLGQPIAPATSATPGVAGDSPNSGQGGIGGTSFPGGTTFTDSCSEFSCGPGPENIEVTAQRPPQQVAIAGVDDFVVATTVVVIGGIIYEMSITPRPDHPPLSGGRSGGKVKDLTGPPSSALPGAGGGRIFITDEDGNVVVDVTPDRAKDVTPGVGFGDKRPLTDEEKDLLDKMGVR